jgi:glycosyltransferase involved in cell wall biosynthesis
MRVAFDAERLRDPNSGLGQFCRALGAALFELQPPDASIFYLVPQEKANALEGARGAPPATTPRRWMRFVQPLDAQVWHATHQDFWIRPAPRAHVVLTIHDLNFLERAVYSAAKQARRLAAVQRKVDRASAIATISEFTARVVRRQLVIPDIPLRVIHNGNPMEASARLTAGDTVDPSLATLAPRSFFLFVGVIHPKKNVHALLPLLRAFPRKSLVLAGPKDHPYAAEVMQAAGALGVAPRVLMPGAVNEDTKRFLYERSRALLLPSLSEGFGLPVVEAMSVGKPAFLSRLTSLPEIGGDAAYYFDSFEPDSMVETIRRGLADHDEHPERRAELMAHAARFSWTKAATAYWSLYSEAHRSPRR